jgi:hypothetical protein
MPNPRALESYFASKTWTQRSDMPRQLVAGAPALFLLTLALAMLGTLR